MRHRQQIISRTMLLMFFTVSRSAGLCGNRTHFKHGITTHMLWPRAAQTYIS